MWALLWVPATAWRDLSAVVGYAASDGADELRQAFPLNQV